VSPGRRALVRRIRKPAYVYRPAQVLRRVANTSRREPRVLLPWGDRVAVNTGEVIGNGIARLGLHELAVSETAYRLVEPGTTVVDVGANLGYFTSLLSHCVGPAGQVHAFEPHPVTFARLSSNVAQFANGVRVTLHECAVSDRDGEAYLVEPTDFHRFAGLPTLGTSGIPVRVTTLDSALPDGPVGFMKLDIEGNELPAFAGATRTLMQTRHLVFEGHTSTGEPDWHPEQVTAALSEYGFRLYGIIEEFRGPRLVPAHALPEFPQWDAPMFLATRDPNVSEHIAGRGWRVLRAGSGRAQRT
jgi:FkbM family methyltransferase